MTRGSLTVSAAAAPPPPVTSSSASEHPVSGTTWAHVATLSIAADDWNATLPAKSLTFGALLTLVPGSAGQIEARLTGLDGAPLATVDSTATVPTHETTTTAATGASAFYVEARCTDPAASGVVLFSSVTRDP